MSFTFLFFSRLDFLENFVSGWGCFFLFKKNLKKKNYWRIDGSDLVKRRRGWTDRILTLTSYLQMACTRITQRLVSVKLELYTTRHLYVRSCMQLFALISYC